MIHNASCQMNTSSSVLISVPSGTTHNAECFINGSISPEQKVYENSGITVADLNRIFPNWEQSMPFFVQARWPKQPVPTKEVIRQSIITGMMYAVEEILRSKS